MKRPELRVEGEAFRGRRFAVPPEGLRLGRSSSNDLPIHDEQLSRNHCLFEQAGPDGIRVTDLAIANGTYVNGNRLGAESVELHIGDSIQVGDTVVTVIGDEPPSRVDLGLGNSASAPVEPVGRVRPTSRRSPLSYLLWCIALVLPALAACIFFFRPDASAVRTQEIAVQAPSLVEMNYEKVVADSTSIFRYAMSLAPDGALRVVIDDLSGEGRHVNRSATLGKGAQARLLEILSDGDFAALDREYPGPDTEPPRLNSLVITFLTTAERRTVRIVNAPEPEAFRRVREKLEAFSMNELGIRALQYSRDKLIEMARDAADTGRMKWEDRDVEYGNLHAAICAYREAIADLETVNPKPPEFAKYEEALAAAKKELDVRYQNQRFVAEQATSVGDWEKAKDELRTLCEMIPNRDDDRYREASLKLVDVEKRLGKKGGRK